MWETAQDMGYAQAKLLGERIIEEATRVSNLQANILRVGQTTGPTNHHGSWSINDWFPSLVASSIYLHQLPDSLALYDVIDRIPVDLVAQIIVNLLNNGFLQLSPGGRGLSISAPEFPDSSQKPSSGTKPIALISGTTAIRAESFDGQAASHPETTADEDAVVNESYKMHHAMVGAPHGNTTSSKIIQNHKSERYSSV
ncbi:hypothetical protein ACLMJK_009452 [Lecanora helva]